MRTSYASISPPEADVNEEIKTTETWIEKTLRNNHYRKIIETIPGFGKILAALAALEIAATERFNSPAKLFSYAGLAPTTHASGGRIYHGNLIPTCNHWLRYAFIEASWKATVSSPYCKAVFQSV